MRKKLTCPLCQKPKLQRLSNHLENVHRVTIVDKQELLRKAREEYVYASRMSFTEFFMSLRNIPLTAKEYKILHCYRKLAEAVWVSKTISNLPPRLLKALKDAYDRYVLTSPQ